MAKDDKEIEKKEPQKGKKPAKKTDIVGQDVPSIDAGSDFNYRESINCGTGVNTGTGFTFEGGIDGVVTSVNGYTGDVVLKAVDVDAYSKGEADNRFINVDEGLPMASKTFIGGIKVGFGLTIQKDGTLDASGVTNPDWNDIVNKPQYFPPVVSNTFTVGGVKPGKGLSIQPDGTLDSLSSTPDWKDIKNKPATFPPPIATSLVLGGIKIGPGFSELGDGTTTPTPDWTAIQNKPAAYPPVIATASLVGGIKVGAGLNIDADGTLMTVMSAPTWNDILNKPTTFPPPISTKTVLGGVKAGAGVTIDPTGILSADFTKLPIASKTVLGGVKEGSGINIEADGTINAVPEWDEIINKPATFPPPIASKLELGGVKPGENIIIDPDGTINAAGAALQPATSEILGGIKVGDNLAITPDGTLSAIGGQGAVEQGTTGQIAYYAEDGYTISGTPWANIENGRLTLGGNPPSGEVCGAIEMKSTQQDASFGFDNYYGADYTLRPYGEAPVKGDIPMIFRADDVRDVMMVWGQPSVVIGPGGYDKLGLCQVKQEYHGIGMDQNGTLILNGAFRRELGGVKVDPSEDTGIDLDEGDATIKLMPAGRGIGGIRLGKHLRATDANGTVAVDFDPYTLPPANATTLGGVKIGAGVNVTADGTISVSASPTAPSLPRNRFVINGEFGSDVSVQWTVPVGCTVFRVTVVGCGGSSGFARASGIKTGASGGGGAGWARETFFDYSAGTIFDLELGASNAINPRATSFLLAGKKLIYATNGSNGRDASTTADFVVGGVGGTGYQINVDAAHMTGHAEIGSGGSGGYAFGLNNGATTFGGAGGGTLFGGESQYLIGSSLGRGCGAPGGGSVQGFDYGITGMPGIIIIEW
jgi:hypothetical protein